MAKQITATGISTVDGLDHAVMHGAPYQDRQDAASSTYVIETSTTRIAVEGTPDDFRRLAAQIVERVEAHERQRERDAA